MFAVRLGQLGDAAARGGNLQQPAGGLRKHDAIVVAQLARV